MDSKERLPITFFKDYRKALPPNPFKVRIDRVKERLVGNFKKVTVFNVDAKIRRVFIKFEGKPDEKNNSFWRYLDKIS